MSDNRGIIYSPSFGAGWSTWAHRISSNDLATDQVLANMIENKVSLTEIIAYAEKKWPGVYTGGLEDCVVEWVDAGTKFKISEYDGSESIVFDNTFDWDEV